MIATPTKAEVFYAAVNADPFKDIADAGESGYKLLGGFANWAPTDDPGAFREINAKEPMMARMIRVVIYGAADNPPVICAEVDVR